LPYFRHQTTRGDEDGQSKQKGFNRLCNGSIVSMQPMDEKTNLQKEYIQ
jgi:hypothetical protein